MRPGADYADDPSESPARDRPGERAAGSLGLAVLPALAVAALVLLPYLRKAFTIDDTLFLLQAQQALHDPQHPTAFVVVWSDVAARLSAIMPSGPIMAYLLLPTVARGGAEWLGHLSQLALLALGLLSTTGLARRLGASWGEARIAALLTATSPAVLGMASTVMPDVAAMTFGVLGIERYLAFLGARSRSRALANALLSALAMAVAALCRTHVGLLLGIAALFAIEEELFPLFAPLTAPGLPAVPPLPRRLAELATLRLLRRLSPLFLALGLVALVLRLTADPLGGTGVVSSTRFFATLVSLPANLLAFLSYLALTVPLVLPWAILRRAQLSRRLILWASLLSLPLFLLAHHPRGLPLAPLVGLSVACLYDLVGSLLRARDARGVVLLAWMGLSLPVAFYIHFAPKYLVPSMPAIAILLARFLCRSPALLRLPEHLGSDKPQAVTLKTAQRVLSGTLIGGALLSLLIIHADAGFADLGRQAASRWIAPRVARGERVWFCGHWGFQWYAQRAGALPLTRDPPLPQPGDLLVASQRADCYHLPRYPDRQTLDTLSDFSIGGRAMASEVGASFFSNGGGFLPWMVSWQPLDRYDLFRLTGPARPPLGTTPPLTAPASPARSSVAGDKRSVP
ncbi:MAG TPA: hypothetical protein PKI03_20890 [Pseudomonadota bacterium]|nr:hypothetical protein [Pseudomonadota bacterium]